MYLSIILIIPLLAILFSQINELKDVCNNGWGQSEQASKHNPEQVQTVVKRT